MEAWCLDREILIFIWRENFALLALRLLSPHLLVSVLVLHICMDGWMDGMDQWMGDPKQNWREHNGKKGSPFGGSSFVGGFGI